MAPIHDLINDFVDSNASSSSSSVPNIMVDKDDENGSGHTSESEITFLKNGQNGKLAQDGQDGELVSELFPEIDKNELTKLMIQTLKDLGYDRASEELQKESDLPLESKAMTQFSLLIKDGEFDSTLKLIDQFVFRKDEKLSQTEMKQQVLFLITRQKFLEELYVSSSDDPANMGAVQILRNEITTLTTTQNIRSLTSLLMHKNSEDLQLKNGWINNSRRASRANLLNEISKFISPRSMVPKHRLFKLLEQSILYQKSLNLYQFGDEEDKKISLYEDIKSDKKNFPDTTIRTLTDHTDEVWYVAFSNDGSKLISCSADTSIYIYDVNDDFKLLRQLKGHNKQIMYASFSPDDSRLLTCSIESRARLWNVETGELVKTFEVDNDPRLWCCDWFPNGEYVVIGSPDKHVHIFNVESGELTYSITGDRITDLKVTTNNRLIVATYESKIHVYDLVNNSFDKIKTIYTNERITNISVSKKNPNQMLLNLSPNELQLWDWSKTILLAKYLGHKQEQYIIRSCFGYDEKIICSGSEDGRVFLWNKEFGALLGVFDAHSGICNCVSWNDAKKSMFASCGDDFVVKIWGPSSQDQSSS